MFEKPTADIQNSVISIKFIPINLISLKPALFINKIYFKRIYHEKLQHTYIGFKYTTHT